MGRGRARRLLAQLKVGHSATHACLSGTPFMLSLLFTLPGGGGFLNDFVHAASHLHWLGCGLMFAIGRQRGTAPGEHPQLIHLDAQVTSTSSSPSASASVP